MIWLEDVPQVNLLPARVQRQTSRTLRIRQWISGNLLLLAVVLVSWALVYQIGEDQRTLQRLVSDESTAYVETQQQLARLAAKSEMLLASQDRLLSLQARESWSQRIAELARALPEDMTVNKLTLSALPVPQVAPVAPDAADAGPTRPPRPVERFELRIEGLARRYDSVSEFSRRLRELQVYDPVRLVRSERQRNGETDMLEYAVSCRRELR